MARLALALERSLRRRRLARDARRWCRSLLALVTVSLPLGCMTLPELWNGPLDPLRHEHDASCGHGYLNDVHLDPCPRDFAGPEAWLGPTGEMEVRVKDPWRGDAPQPERPVPWYIPGGGSSAHADRQPAHPEPDERTPRAGDAPERAPVEDLRRPETPGP